MVETRKFNQIMIIRRKFDDMSILGNLGSLVVVWISLANFGYRKKKKILDKNKRNYGKCL